MTDREKVIKGLECCREMNGHACQKCPYISDCNNMSAGIPHLASDALELLKEQQETISSFQGTIRKLNAALKELKGQEPMMVRLTASTIRCPKCGKQITSRGAIHREIKFCWKCGQAVKWND